MTAAAAMDRSSPNPAPAGWMRLGRFGRPRGLKGEVWFSADNPASETLRSGLTLRLDDGRELTIVDATPTKGRFVLRLDGVGGRSAAEALTNAVALARRDDFAPLAEDEYYHVDLIGLPVLDRSGAELGTVAEVQTTPAHDVLVVRSGRREMLVPVVAEWVRDIDVAGGRLVLNRSDGWVG